MAENNNKDIEEQTKQSVREIKSETKTGLGFVKKAVGAATEDIKDALNNAETSIKDGVKRAKSDIAETEKKVKSGLRELVEKSKKQIQQVREDAIDEISSAVNKTASEAISDVERAFKKSTKEAEKSLEDSAKEAEKALRDSKKEAVDAVREAAKEAVDEQKKKPAVEKAGEQEKKKPTDLATKLLQDILSEVKVIRKVVEKRVSFDPKSGRYRGAGGRYVKEGDVREEGATKEKSEREEKKKGLFSDIRKKFVVVKKTASKKLAPAAEGAKDIKEGVGGLLTNPLVIAGLLAFLAPKETLTFLKGFLGEMLFGENANTFTQGFVAFVGLWSGFKIYNAVANILKVVKGLWTIGRFLFMNPALLLALTTITAVVALMMDFKKKYKERKETKGLEEELKGLEAVGEADRTPEQTKRITELKDQIIQREREGKSSTTGKAKQQALSSFIMPKGMEEAGKRAVEFGVAREKIKNGQPLTPEEQQTYDTYKKDTDPYRSILSDIGGNKKPTSEEITAFKNAVDQQVQATVKPKPETKPSPAPTTPQTPQQTPVDDSRELNRAATQTTSQSAGSVTPVSPQQAEQIAVAETPAPSIGQTINQASTSVEAGYEEKPEDSTTLVAQDKTQIPKPANVVDTIPGIFANRSSLSLYEIFRVQGAFPSAAPE